MKFTSEDLMKAMGLQVGDRVRVKVVPYTNEVYTLIIDKEEGLMLRNESTKELCLLEFLVNLEYEILPRPKRVGDLKCDNNCDDCPLRSVCSWESDLYGITLYNVLNIELSVTCTDEEIYNIVKARLDKEVVEE